MSATRFSFTCRTFNTDICDGFSRLQQRQEFVDMTLVADGHIVKVHQNIIALASPYMKALLQSVPSQHPVVFLNNVSHEILCYILEYIYRGEVQIAVNKIPSFLDAAIALRITGLKHAKDRVQSSETRNTEQDEEEIIPCTKTFSSHDKDTEINNSLTITPNQELGYNLCNVHTKKSNKDTLTNSPNVTSSVTTNIVKELTSNNLCATSNFSSASCSINMSTMSNSYLIMPVSDPWNLSKEGLIGTSSNFKPLNITNENPTTQTNSNLGVSHNLNNSTSKDLNQFSVPSSVTTCSSSTTSNKTPHITIYNDRATNKPIVMINNLDSLKNNEESREENELQNKMENSLSNNNSLEMENNSSSNSKEIVLSKPLYTKSIRGSLQMILDNFMYCAHHQSSGGRKRRWRCIEYRRSRCPVFIDTINEGIVNRKHKHTHHSHQNKIWKKLQSTYIYTSIKSAVREVKTKEIHDSDEDMNQIM